MKTTPSQKITIVLLSATVILLALSAINLRKVNDNYKKILDIRKKVSSDTSQYLFDSIVAHNNMVIGFKDSFYDSLNNIFFTKGHDSVMWGDDEVFHENMSTGFEQSLSGDVSGESWVGYALEKKSAAKNKKKHDTSPSPFRKGYFESVDDKSSVWMDEDGVIGEYEVQEDMGVGIENTAFGTHKKQKKEMRKFEQGMTIHAGETVEMQIEIPIPKEYWPLDTNNYTIETKPIKMFYELNIGQQDSLITLKDSLQQIIDSINKLVNPEK